MQDQSDAAARRQAWRRQFNARVKRVELLLKQHPGVADQPDAAIRRQAWRIVHYGSGARLAGRYEESSDQLAKLAKLVRPLREFLESKVNLNLHARYALEESGFLDLDGRDLADVVALLKRAELIAPRGKGRRKDEAKPVIDDLAASAIRKLTGKDPAYTTAGNTRSGAFVDLMAKLYPALHPRRRSAETAARNVVAKRKARRGE